MEQRATIDYHVPVLLEPVLRALDVRCDGIYLDGTAGGGGHSFAIASRLTAGRLIALDQDPDAVAQATKRLSGLPAQVVRSNFAQMRQVLDELGIPSVDGILLDLGVSSHQLDTASRGFSYHQDAPLDMRMSQSGTTAADLVNTLSEEALCRILWDYGEEKFARSIVRTILSERQQAPITTTLQLAECVKKAVPAAAKRDGHPARRTFQALRIAVNDEMGCLSSALDTALDCLAPGGRLAVITFHSLEDRLVKQRFRDWMQGCICPPDCPICICHRKPRATAVLKKPVEADAQELAANSRSRSAKLRCIQKTEEGSV